MTQHYRAQPITRWLLLATVLLILYGSLFPFRFSSASEPILRLQRPSRGDLVANVLLYLPFGLCLALAWPTRWRRSAVLASTVAAGTLLSLAVELLQASEVARVSSLTDVIVNAFGTLAGALIAVAYFQFGMTLGIPGIVTGRAQPVALALLLLWLAFRLAPFVPTIDLQKYKDALKPLFIDPQIGLLETFRYLAGWLAVSYVVRRLWRREHALAVLAGIMAIVLAGRIAVVDKVLVPAEVVALLLCIPLAVLLAALAKRRQAGILAMLLAATIILQGLQPFKFASQAQPFNWIPFRTSLGDNLELNYSVLLEKSFWYFSLVWLLTRRGSGVAAAAFSTAALLAGIELAQLWLPGRSADITDPLLAIVAGLLISRMQRET